ncbi:MAG: helix-turn-helix domain-containing protein [Rhodopseudomonas sp.]|nr:helix-turn-helix domain-containing protein [Rhodopseudomonas sp.]
MTLPPPVPKSGCPNCILVGRGLCGFLFDIGLDQPFPDLPPISQKQVEFAARRTIFHRNQVLDGVPVICDGWAAATIKLSDGSRQILSFILPGELVTSRLVFESQLDVSIDSITNGSYRSFDRKQLRAAIDRSPQTFDRIMSAYSTESRRADQLITALGRRSAVERVAGLLVDLWDRLDRLGKIEGDSIEFPLRQTHIADATGLTTVYVNKVLAEFRNDGLIDISDRHLQILDMTQLQRQVN